MPLDTTTASSVAELPDCLVPRPAPTRCQAKAIRQVHTGRTTRRKSVVIAISRKRSPRFASTALAAGQ